MLALRSINAMLRAIMPKSRYVVCTETYIGLGLFGPYQCEWRWLAKLWVAFTNTRYGVCMHWRSYIVGRATLRDLAQPLTSDTA